MKSSLSPKAKIWLKKMTPGPVTLLLLGLIIYVWFRPPAWVSDEQRAVPNVQVMLTDGRVVSMESLRGKVVLVNFWATWCPYCRHEMPDMQAFYRDWHARGFEILALSIEDNPALVAAFMEKAHYTFPAALATAEVQQAFGGANRVPLSFIVDKKGVIRHKVSGQVYYARLEGLVEPLLKD